MFKIGLILVGLWAAADGQTDVAKISSSVMRVGTTVYTFYSQESHPTEILAFRTSASTTAYYALPANEPPWVDFDNKVDVDPDVNYLGENQIRVYFTAYESKSSRSAIGVAMTDVLAAANYRFSTLVHPLVVSQYGETLSHPSLYKASDNNLYLYYQNSTADVYGSVTRVLLTADGLRIKT